MSGRLRRFVSCFSSIGDAIAIGTSSLTSHTGVAIDGSSLGLLKILSLITLNIPRVTSGGVLSIIFLTNRNGSKIDGSGSGSGIGNGVGGCGSGIGIGCILIRGASGGGRTCPAG